MKYIETKSVDKSIVFANDNATIVVQKRGVTTV
jgi:bifunctional ADP-heptose synthase (sugar kinase/adenylyltransferase)